MIVFKKCDEDGMVGVGPHTAVLDKMVGTCSSSPAVLIKKYDGDGMVIDA